jgi:hypothetical protein
MPTSTVSRAPTPRPAAFEAEHGEITEAEMGAAARRARGRAVVVRGGPAPDHKGGPGERGVA